jgi:cobalt-precorrin-5B (C1)-methyltransferase
MRRYDGTMNEKVASDDHDEGRPDAAGLRRGWTTGACATAAAKAAYTVMLGGEMPDTVNIRLSRGLRAEFELAEIAGGADSVSASVIKDAGDDPDVTHGARICCAVTPAEPGAGVRFAAGPGVGTVTLPGLPIPPGEPAINPKPREMIAAALDDVAAEYGVTADVLVTISIPGGEALSEKTANARLGIVGGLSVLGTTGVVIPYSCASWVHSIHRGVDVARATGVTHVAAATGRTSEAAVQAHFGLGEQALIDMGDFAGGLLKYVRAYPVPRLTIGGGFGKLSKLAAGHMDLHSSRSAVDLEDLVVRLSRCGANPTTLAVAQEAVSAGGVLVAAASQGLEAALCENIARGAREVCRATLGGAVDVDVFVVARDGSMQAHVGP